MIHEFHLHLLMKCPTQVYNRSAPVQMAAQLFKTRFGERNKDAGEGLRRRNHFHRFKFFTLDHESRLHRYHYLMIIGYGVLPSIKYCEFMGLCVCIHDGLKVVLIFFTPTVCGPHHWLTATHYSGLSFWVDPGEDLKENRRYNVLL